MFFVFKCKFLTSAVYGVKKFEEIPGPKSVPLIGTLYQYLPFLGKFVFLSEFSFFVGTCFLTKQVNTDLINSTTTDA